MKPMKLEAGNVSYDYEGNLYIIDLQDKIWSLNNREALLFKDHKRYVTFTEGDELVFGANHGLQMFKSPKFILNTWKPIRRRII